MPTPLIVEEMFALNPNSKITYHKDWVCIDDFYQNIDQIQNMFENMYVESWKMSKWSRNFRDYYDCRPTFGNWEPDRELLDARLGPLNRLICRLTGLKDVSIEKSVAFNVFKHKKQNVPVHMQHHPHYDSNMVNVLVYIDEHANGGTALYENVEIKNTEGSNLIIDVSKFKIKEVIPAKPNRCAIFSGDQLHGAYIQDNDIYYNNWRITQATIVRNTEEMINDSGQ